MKSSRFLLAMALVPLGCNPGAQNAAPPAPVATAAAAAPAVEETVPQAATPATASEPAAAAPLVEAQRATAPRPSAPKPSAPARTSGSSPATAAQTYAPAAVPAAPPVRVRIIVPAGTLLPIELQSTVSSQTSKEGDLVLAVLTESVPLDGFTLDKGAEVRGTVLTAVPAKRVKGRAHLVVAFDAVMENGEKVAITTEALDSEAASTGSKDKKVIAGGAVGGLILGAIKDGKKGAVVGTVLGAAAGTGAVLIMKGDEVELPRGARLTLAVTK